MYDSSINGGTSTLDYALGKVQLRVLACKKLQSVAAALVDEFRRVPDSVALPIVE